MIILLIAWCAMCSMPFISFRSLYFQNLDNVRLHARFNPGDNGKGVLIAGDMSHDISELKLLAGELKKSGYSVFLFDLPSQGGSLGTVPYRYKTSNYIAEQFYCALVVFAQESGLSVSDIHIVSYGEGARAVLQTACFGYISPRSVTLVGPAVNLSDRADFDIINFTLDTAIEWIGCLDSETFACPVHMVYTSTDEISTVKDNEILSEKLDNGLLTKTCLKLGFHSMLMSSASVSMKVCGYLCSLDGIPFAEDRTLYTYVPSQIVCALLFVYLLYKYSVQLRYSDRYAYERVPRIPEMPRKHLIKKMLYWIPAAMIMVLVPCGLYYLPISMPYKSIMPVMALSSYGLILSGIYCFGAAEASREEFVMTQSGKTDKKGAILTLALVAAFIALTSFTGSRNLFGFGAEWHWQAALSIIFAVGFYADRSDRKLTAFTMKENICSFAIGYASFAVLPIVLVVLGLFSSAVSALGYVAILFGTVMLGNILDTLKSPPVFTALLQGFIFQMAVFPNMTMFKA